MKIGVTFNKQRKPETEQPAREIVGWLRNNGHKVYINPVKKILESGLDFIVAVGGDGTVLHTADRVADFAIPLVGVNFGRKGYLCDMEYDEVFKKLEKILKGNFKVKKNQSTSGSFSRR